jgi:hypothetical protein
MRPIASESRKSQRQVHRSMGCAKLGFHLRKGAVMSNKLSTLKSIAIGAALLVGASCIAHAEDNSMNPFNGESYLYFKNAQTFSSSAPSSWRQSHPHGLSARERQALSSESPVWQLADPSTTGIASTNAIGVTNTATR